jgi:hypothetical protein
MTSSPRTSHTAWCIAIVGSMWARDHPHPVTDGERLVRCERDVLVAAEPDLGALDRRVAVVHAQRLQTDIGDGEALADRDDGADDAEGLLERQVER